jgi:hypothetical protein
VCNFKIDDVETQSATLLHTKHNEISIMFSQIPNEITQDVFDRLPIHECRCVVDAHKDYNQDHERMKAIYAERVSLERYFTRNLYDGKQMMRLLAETDSYLFGSRAIEYFTPGTLENDSDWNFHVSSSPRLRCHFMKKMEEFGVEWQDATMSFFNSIKTTHMTIVIKRSELDFIIEDSKSFEMDEFHQLAIKCFIESSAHIQRHAGVDTILYFVGIIGSDSFECMDVTSERESDDLANMMSLEGIIKFKGKEMKVEVAFTNDIEYTHTELIHDFCFSLQQCFINGFGAVHMYGKLAASKVSYKWDRFGFLSDHSNQEKTNALAHKYTLRRYQIQLRPYDKDSMINQRSHCDSESIFIPYLNQFGWDDNIWNLMQMKSCWMYWVESKSDTYFRYTKYSNYFSQHTMDQCSKFRESVVMPLDKEYLTMHASL